MKGRKPLLTLMESVNKFRIFLLTPKGIWMLFILWSLFVSNLWLPRNWNLYGSDDWDLTYSTFEVARKAIVESGEWPSYNLYASFGSDLDANPQAVHASIFFIPVLLFGTFYGYKLSILFALILGLFGAYKLFEKISRDKSISIGMAMVFCSASYFSRHIFGAGHSNILYFYLLPWLVYFLQRFFENKKSVNLVLVILILMQTICGGAPFVFIAFSMFIMLWSIGLVWIEKAGKQVLLSSSFAILSGFALSLWKIIPVFFFWQDSPRLVNDESGINPLLWLQTLGDFETDTRTRHGWHEFTLGFSLVLLALIFYKLGFIKNWRKWMLLFLFLFWLSMGNTPQYFNPWYFLNHYIPVFTSLRVPYRFGILIVFIFCILFVKLYNFNSDKRLIYIILLAVTLMQTLHFNSISKKLIMSSRLEDIETLKTRNSVVNHKEGSKLYLEIKNGNWVVDAYEPLSLSPVYDTLSEKFKGAQLISGTSKSFKLKAEDSTVQICQRYSPYWMLKGIGKIRNSNGLLRIENCRGIIDMYYLNPYAGKGVIASIISAILLVIAWFFYGFRKIKKRSLQGQ